MSEEEWKRVAAERAAELVESGMLVGLGSGSTLAEVIKILGKRRVDADFVASSLATEDLAGSLDLRLVPFTEESHLDIAIDGADEVDPNFSMIKGGGGAHTREKIIANAAKRVAIVVDRTKLTRELGKKRPVPVEVIPFGHSFTLGLLDDLGGKASLRKTTEGEPYVTDNGNWILDVEFESVEAPADLEATLNNLPGVVENGIFVGLADQVFVGYEGGCEILNSKKDFLNFVESIGRSSDF